MNTVRWLGLVMAGLLWQPAWAQMSLLQAVELAAHQNPEVQAAWQAYQAAGEEQRVAWGDYLPNLDLSADIGRERVDDPRFAASEYSRRGIRLTLTQMLFDGFYTRNEVARLGYAKSARYYELQDASTVLARDTVEAYVDLLRQRELVELAKANYLQHKQVYQQIEERVRAGVSRSVDLEQASGRLALSESNLLTEVTNLHDVMARFQRLTGEVPTAQLEEVVLPDASVPSALPQALQTAYGYSPYLNAAIENIRSTQEAYESQSAPMMPRLDLRLRQDNEWNQSGIDGRYEEQAIELVLTYNLYNGGADSAKRRQYAHLVQQARDIRLKRCRDVRQELTIAYNDIQQLAEQMQYLDRNQLAIGKARKAYRKQFDIGQRTLLDLLDSENEYFETQRAYVNAQRDRQVAVARTLAAMGILLPALQLQGVEGEVLALPEHDEEELIGVCPAEPLVGPTIDKDRLLDEILGDERFRRVNDEAVALRVDVKFAFDSAQIDEGFEKELQDAADFLHRFPTLSAVVEGHTDGQGSERYNQVLSQQRAEVVKARLVDLGIEATRLEAKGFGESQPLQDNATEEGRRINRRVELMMQSTMFSSDAAGSAESTVSAGQSAVVWP